MYVSGKTDCGLVRQVNEDNIFFDSSLFIVADGMGGHLAGEIASFDAIACIKDFMTENADNEEVLFIIDKAVKFANKYIFDKSQTDISYKGMGTTVTLAKMISERLYYAHVGDSRIYLFRNKELKQITTDHSLVAELLISGQITPEQALVYPNKNVITKAVGTAENVEADTGYFDLVEDDIIILCSDGVTNMLNDETICKIIVEHENNIDTMTDTFVSEANAAGGSDNISVICLKY